jgi:L-cysteine/cystine lyase
MATDTDHLSSPLLRQYTPAVASSAYLNTGTAGPLLEPAAVAMARAAQQEVVGGRVGAASFEEFRSSMGALRAALAELVGAGEDEIGLTHHTTEGMNIVAWGLDWSPGDRVVTTTLEHGGGLLPLYQLHARRGVQVDFAAIGVGGADETLDALSRALEEPARLLVVSNVTYGTGAVLPLAEIIALAHARGVLVAVDGAQSVGAQSLQLDALGVDFYAFPGQKWLCGPEGTGGLFVRRGLLEALTPTFVGFLGVDHDRYRPDDPDSLVAGPGAARYEVGSLYRPGITGLLEAVRWHLTVGADNDVVGRIHRLTAAAIDRISRTPGLTVLTPRAAHAGLVCFTVSGAEPAACVSYLYDHGVTIRAIPDNGSLRLSCGFFNTPEEIERALALVLEHRRSV